MAVVLQGDHSGSKKNSRPCAEYPNVAESSLFVFVPGPEWVVEDGW